MWLLRFLEYILVPESVIKISKTPSHFEIPESVCPNRGPSMEPLCDSSFLLLVCQKQVEG